MGFGQPVHEFSGEANPEEKKKEKRYTRPRYIMDSSPIYIMFLISDPVFIKPISLLHVIWLIRSQETSQTKPRSVTSLLMA